MELLRRSEIKTVTEFALNFDWPGHWRCGFSFECDEEGNVDEAKLTDCARENLRQCRTGSVDGKPIGAGYVDSWHRTYREPAIGRCTCGRKVVLYGFTNTCDCGCDYNSAGQLLASRDQWGEETGESLADIMQIQ